MDIALLRLYNQQIAQQSFSEPSQVVAWLGAIQAQDYRGALWSLGLRSPDATEADIERAVVDGSIIRTWPMRGTLHFVAAQDIRWMLQLLAPRLIAGSLRRNQQLNLEDATFERSKEVFSYALQGGLQLTRGALYTLLEAAQISTTGQRGIHILWRLSVDGLLCSGGREGKQQTFALLHERTPAATTLPRDEALAELARRYFTSRGPATVQDFTWWSGLAAADARAGLEMAKNQLVQEVVDSHAYWMAPRASTMQSHGGDAHLLPGFDEYLLGYRDRSAVLDPIYTQRIVPGNNGIFNPTIVLDGKVAGTWKRSFSKDAAVITYSPFSPLDEAQKQAIAVAAERYGRFMEKPTRCGEG